MQAIFRSLKSPSTQKKLSLSVFLAEHQLYVLSEVQISALELNVPSKPHTSLINTEHTAESGERERERERERHERRIDVMEKVRQCDRERDMLESPLVLWYSLFISLNANWPMTEMSQNSLINEPFECPHTRTHTHTHRLHMAACVWIVC